MTRSHLSRLRGFVNDGGGLLMIGGHNTFGPGGYEDTDLAAALPVTLGSRAQAQETTPFLPQLTAQGEAHPIFAGITGYFSGPGGRKPDPALQKLPQLLGCVTVPGAKPGAAVLAVHPTRRNEAGPLVVLASQNFGAGRSAAFTADTTWQWYFALRALGVEGPYQRFWGQLIRWLANIETKARQAAPAVVLRIDRSYIRVGQTVQLTCRVQDEKGRATDTARVACTITAANGESAPPGGQEPTQVDTIPLSAARGAGIFQASYRPLKEGSFKLKVAAADSSGKTLGTDELSLIVAPHSAEMDRLARDDASLQMIADRSDGRYTDIFGLPDVIKQVADRHADRSARHAEADIYPLHNFPLLFLAFVVFLTAEWLLRRNWQLH